MVTVLGKGAGRVGMPAAKLKEGGSWGSKQVGAQRAPSALHPAEMWGVKHWARDPGGGRKALLLQLVLSECGVGSSLGQHQKWPWDTEKKNCFAAAQRREKPRGIDLQ